MTELQSWTCAVQPYDHSHISKMNNEWGADHRAVFRVFAIGSGRTTNLSYLLRYFCEGMNWTHSLFRMACSIHDWPFYNGNFLFKMYSLTSQNCQKQSVEKEWKPTGAWSWTYHCGSCSSAFEGFAVVGRAHIVWEKIRHVDHVLEM